MSNEFKCPIISNVQLMDGEEMKQIMKVTCWQMKDTNEAEGEDSDENITHEEDEDEKTNMAYKKISAL